MYKTLITNIKSVITKQPISIDLDTEFELLNILSNTEHTVINASLYNKLN